MAGLKIKDEYSGSDVAAAASLGLAVLKKAKQNTWAGLIQAAEAQDPDAIKAFQALDLSAEQLTLLSVQPVLTLLQVSPAVVPAVCPDCGHYVLVSATAPSSCMVTSGCIGKPYKIAAATSSTDPVSVPADVEALNLPEPEPETEPEPPADPEPETPEAESAEDAPEPESEPEPEPEPSEGPDDDSEEESDEVDPELLAPPEPPQKLQALLDAPDPFDD